MIWLYLGEKERRKREWRLVEWSKQNHRTKITPNFLTLLDGSFDSIFILIHTILATAQRRSALQLTTLGLLQTQTVRQLAADSGELAGRDQFAHLTLGVQRRAFHRLRTTKEQVSALRVKTTSECVDHSNLVLGSGGRAATEKKNRLG